MEKLLTIFAAVVIFIVWGTIRARRIQNDRLKKTNTILNNINQLLSSNASEMHLYDVTYSDAREVMEWYFQIQNNEIYKKPDKTSEIGTLIEKFRAKPNPYRPIKNSESFLLQINNIEYLVILSPGRATSVLVSALLEIEKVTPGTPLRNAHPVNDYTTDWTSVSANYRKKQCYICQNCGVDLSTERMLLHTHHKNRDKGDNREKNLIALCVVCHKMQPYHEQRLFVSDSDSKKIALLKKQQGLENQT